MLPAGYCGAVVYFINIKVEPVDDAAQRYHSYAALLFCQPGGSQTIQIPEEEFLKLLMFTSTVNFKKIIAGGLPH